MGKVAEDVWGWFKSQIGDKAALWLALAVFGLFGVSWARSVIVEAADERVKPVRDDVEKVKAAQARYEGDVHEFAQDVRELYRVSPVLRRSERLEAPFPSHDGGP